MGGADDAPSVILMHGGGQTRHSWAGPMRELLDCGYRVINLDARGHGESDWPSDGDYRLDTLVADLRCVLSTLPSLPALVGASLGGATQLRAVGMAERGIAAALVLVDIVPQVETMGTTRIADFMRRHTEGFASLDEAANAVAEYNPHRPRPSDPSGLMKNLRTGSDGRYYWHWDPRFIADPRRESPRQIADQLEEAAPKVRVPTLLVRGMLSDVVTDAGVRALRDAIPHLEVRGVNGAGHMVVGDRNDRFHQAVIPFLHQHHPVP
ncbi:alpha/beta fold hydrolase [Sinimarinibacterium thermocellulolyticum]|uniref:Alpha/beta hydrolase n=1 Tax=Sinimarinibacterium thermocellulolyticum TaxID=3170016 RepID=A0ABV2ADR4_9GAMM